jgi:hypothetical protein
MPNIPIDLDIFRDVVAIVVWNFFADRSDLANALSRERLSPTISTSMRLAKTHLRCGDDLLEHEVACEQLHRGQVTDISGGDAEVSEAG